MLLKLMKYDFKYMLRIFVPLWITFLAAGLLSRLTHDFSSSGIPRFWLGYTGTHALYILLFAGINIVIVILAAQRFYAGLLKDEGYLMFTLPVKPWQLVGAKGITAAAVVVVNALLGILFMVIVWGWKSVLSFFDGFTPNNDPGFSVFFYSLLAWVTAFLSIFIIGQLFLIYASIALERLAEIRRLSRVFGAYAVLNLAFYVLFIPYTITKPYWLWVPSVGYNPYKVLILWLSPYLAIQIAVCFVITVRVFSKKLNLE